MWEIDLSGATALVTGASRGIGRAISVGLGVAGAEIVAVGRSQDTLGELCAELARAGSCGTPVVADLANPDSVEMVVDTAWKLGDGLDIVINAAGVMIRRDLPDVSPDEFDELMAVNLRAPFMLSQAIGWRMKKRRRGCIINIASLAGEEVTGAPLPYQASKAGLVHLTRGFASRLAPHVRVNAVGPGYIRTAMSEGWLDIEENSTYVESRSASGRSGVPDDVVGAVVFLASPAASYINGQHLRIDGGWGI